MDTFELIAAERLRLADELDQLSEAEWHTGSLCDGWDAHTVAAHLNLGWSSSLPTIAKQMVRARGNIDRAFDRMSRDLATELGPQACVARLREHAADRFTPPAMGPEAPLTDVITHGGDILQPLGRRVAVSPEALAVSLRWLTTGSRKGFLSASRTAGLSFAATDIDQRFGAGPAEVRGPALAIVGALVRRPAWFAQLEGDGAGILSARG